MPQNAASDPGLHCLLRIFVTATGSKIIFFFLSILRQVVDDLGCGTSAPGTCVVCLKVLVIGPTLQVQSS